MNSNAKLVLFFLCATVFNILLMIAMFLVLAVIGIRLLGPNPDPTLYTVVLFVGLTAAIVLTFLVYGKVMKWVTVKFQLEKHIPQLFKGKRK